MKRLDQSQIETLIRQHVKDNTFAISSLISFLVMDHELSPSRARTIIASMLREKKLIEVNFSSVELPSVQKSSYWIPGTMMIFKSDNFCGLGIVVSNVGSLVSVFWNEACNESFCTYNACHLNPRVIRRADV